MSGLFSSNTTLTKKRISRPGLPERFWGQASRDRADTIKPDRIALFGLGGRDGIDWLAADGSVELHLPHRPLHRAVRDVEAFTRPLTPDLAHSARYELLLEYAPHLAIQG